MGKYENQTIILIFFIKQISIILMKKFLQQHYFLIQKTKSENFVIKKIIKKIFIFFFP